MDSYWSSPTAARQQRGHRRSEALYFSLGVEPQRKGRRGANESDVAFRAAVRESLLAFGLRGWPRAPLALDFSFTTTRKQPAGIEAYAKHYQDLLEPRGRADDTPPHLYRCDRQIKLLFVRCWHGWEGEQSPNVSLVCRPRRHAVADLEAAAQLEAQDDDEDDYFLDPRDRQYETRLAEEWARDAPEEHREFAEWNARYAVYEGNRRLQDSLLRANDRHLTFLLTSRASPLITGRPDLLSRRLANLGIDRNSGSFAGFPLLEAGTQLRDLLIQVRLPALPMSSGGSELFRAAVELACREFAERHKFLRPLLVPLRITLLVVPPSQGKDLDNIVLNVMHAVNTVLEPHPEPWLLAPSLRPAERAIARRERALSRLRQTRQVGITSYQVIELARSATDPIEGSLRMVLGHGDNLSSTWAAAAERVDEHFDRDR